MRLKLIQLREAAKQTQQTTSEAVGISRSHYSQIETGDKDPSLKVGLRIKSFFKYKKDDIFFNSERPV